MRPATLQHFFRGNLILSVTVGRLDLDQQHTKTSHNHLHIGAQTNESIFPAEFPNPSPSLLQITGSSTVSGGSGTCRGTARQQYRLSLKI